MVLVSFFFDCFSGLFIINLKHMLATSSTALKAAIKRINHIVRLNKFIQTH